MAGPFGGLPSRWPPSGAPVGTAVVLPGSGYSPAAPHLEYARQAALQHGYAVQQVWWERPEHAEDWSVWVGDQLAAAVAAEPSPPSRVLVVGKSLGTRAAPYAAGQSWPAVWFTPLLRVDTVVEGIRANRAPQLLVGGLDDEHHDASVAATLGELPDVTVLEIPAGRPHPLVRRRRRPQRGDPARHLPCTRGLADRAALTRESPVHR